MNNGTGKVKKGPIAYMASNHVAANILMIILIVGGFVTMNSLKQEVFPEFDLDMINVTVVYPGATPAEVEEAIVQPIERAVSGVDNVKRIRANANENVGSVILEVMTGADKNQVLQDTKSEVDRILTFPEEAERPVVSVMSNRQEVILLVVSGDASELALTEQAERVRDDLLAYEDITNVVLTANRPYEIGIEIEEETLQKYHLTLPQIAHIVRSSSIDLAGGKIRTSAGEVLVRTTEKRFTGTEFDSVVVYSGPNGERVLLGDIAEVKDGFEDMDLESRFNGEQAVMVRVFRVGDQKPTKISETVKAYVEQRNAQLPESIKINVYMDWSEILEGRMNLLLKNGMIGLILVLIILTLFLEIRLAFWVSAGIAISFLGSMILLPWFDVSINMMSLFAFLMILGIVVDDAIVVGENIFIHRRKFGKPHYLAAVDGTREMTKAVVFAGLTTIAAFAPLLFVGGFFGSFMGVIPTIIISVLVLSLIESFFILPSHLNGRMVKSEAKIWGRIESKRSHVDRGVNWVIEKTYMGTLRWAQENRYLTVAIAISMLLIVIGLVGGGYVGFTFISDVDADEVTVMLEMPPGTPFEETKRVAESVLAVAFDLIEETDVDREDGESNLNSTFTLYGAQISDDGPHGTSMNVGSNRAQIFFQLDPVEERTVRTPVFAEEWRKRVGELPGVESLTFRADIMQGGADMEIQLAHENYDVLLTAIDRLKAEINAYPGTSEVNDSHTDGKRELRLRLKPEAQTLGLTETDLAMQVRGAFYGSEAMRVQRGKDEVKVMVRYPEEDRRNIASIENMRIRTPMGQEIPFSQAAYVEEGRGFSSIGRSDRRRVVNITSSIDSDVTSADEILARVSNDIMPQMLADYPGLSFDLEGQSRQERESMMDLMGAFAVGILMIYALLAIPFRSFMQPLIVMSAIPFGIVGAVIGHILLGYPLSMISMFGIVALNGVVVNSSLVMIDFINKIRERDTSASVYDAVMEAGSRRFRPIVMTATTTFFGLMPMILETSIQARFLIPMAISLGFGVLFSTGITLVLVPVLYLILEDFKRFFGIKSAVEGEGEGPVKAEDIQPELQTVS
jgi:multidrug efflux pump subunit AcrB